MRRDADGDGAAEDYFYFQDDQYNVKWLTDASGYRRLIDEFGYAHGDLARTLGKSRPHLANMIRLLDLPSEV